MRPPVVGDRVTVAAWHGVVKQVRQEGGRFLVLFQADLAHISPRWFAT